MATIRFFIGSEKKALASIYVSLSLGRRQRYICKTGLMVETVRWSNDTETIRQRKLSENDLKLISRIASLRSYLDSEVRFNTQPKSKEWLKCVIDKQNNVKGAEIETLNGYIANFIAKASSGDIKNKNGKNYAKGTITNYKSFHTALNEYQGIYKEERAEELIKQNKLLRPRKIIDFEDVTVDFYNSFVAYLSNEGFALNTMDKHIGSLKYFMAKALTEKKHSNREFKESAFGGFTEDSHAIYLNQDEIEKIYTADLSEFTPGHLKARDAFIVLCETALRVSDYNKVSVSIRDMSGVKMIEIFMQKTEKRVLIPLTARMNELLTRYKGKLPVISEQKVNEYIKVIARECKIIDPVSWSTQKFGKKYTASEDKCDLCTCHTGRRSAATNMYLAGIKPIDIMKITGHKTEKSFMKYIRISEEETARNLAKHPYFNTLRVAT